MFAASRSISYIIGKFLSILGPRYLFVSLVIVSAACGILFLPVFRRFSDQSALRDTKRKLQAHLLEFRLYYDEPSVIWRSYRAILRLNATYLRLLLAPAALIAIPVFLLLTCFSPFYDSRPLRVGEPATVTVKMKRAWDPAGPLPGIATPDAIRVETPAIRIFKQHQVSWRVRPQAPVRGELVIEVGNERISKSISAGNLIAPASGLRSDSFFSPLWNPSEAALASNVVESVAVQYPDAAIGPAGVHVHWMVWFSMISLLTALLLRKKFRVAI